MRTALIVLHAVAGVAAFLAGLVAAFRPGDRRPFRVYAPALVIMIVCLVGAVVTGWPQLDATNRAVNVALTALAGYLALRAQRAGRRQLSGEHAGYLDDLGFTLIALFDGFAIVAAIDLGAPAWLTAVIAIGAVAVGIAGIGRLQARGCVPPATGPDPTADSRPAAPRRS